MMVRRMARRIREPHFCALDPSGDPTRPRRRQIARRLHHPGQSAPRISPSGRSGFRSRLQRVAFWEGARIGAPADPPGSHSPNPRGEGRPCARRLPQRCGSPGQGHRASRRRIVSWPRLRVSDFRRTASPGSRCCRVGRVPWPGKRRAGINGPTIHLRRSVVKKPLRPRGSPIWRSNDGPSFVPFGHPERKAFFAPA